MSRPGMTISLEIILSSLTGPAAVRYAVLREDISGRENDPDRIVGELLESPPCGLSPETRNSCFIHSTSWRFEPPRTLVLTYFVYSDRDLFENNPGKLLRLRDAVLCSGSTPQTPRPAGIAEENVVAHGLRHLSHLVRQNSQNVCSILTAESIRSFRGMEIGMAGRV
jgi:hypothetical protein